MIIVNGPNWPSVFALQDALRGVPESGTLRWAGGHGNKLEQLRLMAVAGVAIPPVTEDIREALSWVEEGLVFARRYHHKEGVDIVVAGEGEPISKLWRKRDFWSKFLPSREEWRIHVFGGRSICRSKKVVGGEIEDVSCPWTNIVRSYRNGWRFMHSPQPPRGIRRFAKQMVAGCGYLFGACDILVREDGGFVALEVNSAPALSPATLAAYVAAIRRHFA